MEIQYYYNCVSLVTRKAFCCVFDFTNQSNHARLWLSPSSSSITLRKTSQSLTLNDVKDYWLSTVFRFAQSSWHIGIFLSLARFHNALTAFCPRSFKCVLRYIRGTTDYGITYLRGPMVKQSFVDFDYGGDTVDRKSMSGYIVKVREAMVRFEVKRRKQLWHNQLVKRRAMHSTGGYMVEAYLQRSWNENLVPQYACTLRQPGRDKLGCFCKAFMHSGKAHWFVGSFHQGARQENVRECGSCSWKIIWCRYYNKTTLPAIIRWIINRIDLRAET